MRILLILSVVLCTSLAFAQNNYPTVGVGVSLNANATTNYAFHLPVSFEKFRINPELGIRINSTHTGSISSYPGSISSSTTDNTSRNINVAAGIYYLISADHDFGWYAGPRLGLVFASTELDNTSSTMDSVSTSTVLDKRNTHSLNYTIGLVVGGEYFFMKHFSLGAEVQLYYLNQGVPVVTETRTSTPLDPNATVTTSTSSSSSLNQATAVYLRWYF